MFGFLNSREVSDDAVRMVHSVEQMIVDMETLTKDGFIAKFAGVGADVPDNTSFSFRVRHEPDFVFHYGEVLGDLSISVTGGPKYAGFSLYPRPGSYTEWHCSAKDGISYKATAGARKMVKLLSKKFGIECFDNIF